MIAITNGTGPKTNLEVLTEEVSASRLTLWSQCRLKWYFKYVAHIAKAPTPALHVGKVLHAVLQEWNRARWKSISFDEENVRQTFSQAWDEEQHELDIEWHGDERKTKDSALVLVELYLRETPIPADEKPQAVEVRLEADLSNHGLPNLIGILDLVRAGGVIVDFKTSAQTPDPERLAHQTEIQLISYGLLYRNATEQTEAGFELHHLVKTKQPKLVITPLPPITGSQQNRLFRLIESYVEGVKREDFVPSPGLQCSACQYFNECRRWS